MINLHVKSNGQELFKYPRVARTFWERLKGLLGTDSIDYEACLVFCRCSSVHNFFMKYAIGVIYLDQNNMVLYCEILKPWRIGKIVRNTKSLIECNAQKLKDLNLKKGDKIEIIYESFI